MGALVVLGSGVGGSQKGLSRRWAGVGSGDEGWLMAAW